MVYRILIADDDKDIRSVLRLYLEDAGYEVLEAADGLQTLQVLEDREIDLCLLDIMMPELDGYQVLKHVRETDDVPIIVISAKGQDPEKIKANVANFLELDAEAAEAPAVEAVAATEAPEFEAAAAAEASEAEFAAEAALAEAGSGVAEAEVAALAEAPEVEAAAEAEALEAPDAAEDPVAPDSAEA